MSIQAPTHPIQLRRCSVDFIYTIIGFTDRPLSELHFLAAIAKDTNYAYSSMTAYTMEVAMENLDIVYISSSIRKTQLTLTGVENGRLAQQCQENFKLSRLLLMLTKYFDDKYPCL